MTNRKKTSKSCEALTKALDVLLPKLEKSINEKLHENYYNTKLPYGEKNSPEREAYYNDERHLCEKFKKDAFTELDIVNNPKRDKLYSIAYSMGHSSGYSEIWCYMSEMADLIKD